MKFDFKREAKFGGKMITYFAIVTAVITSIRGDYFSAGLSFIMIFIGCAMHEYSE